ncbi:DUF3341 domain-containing protein [candidate division GN15 bacterium]|uniref:DUF3341 domain-containing protein n=1 Tax=candidate division GN15 bacterium TaxID=2072418 RepID=A0A855X955_9BACT|nr:MAG: DUF3341 domain-containing protein [candidate division GN15 bacterium]
MNAANEQTYGIIARFESPAELLRAAEKVRDAGYKRFDCHSPFPIHGMDHAMGMKGSKVGYIAGICGAIGGIGGLTLQWWTSTVAYPVVISGKPFFSYQAYVPITFGLTVLLAAFGAFFGMLITNRLPRWFDGLFYSEQFSSRVTNDGFFVSIDSSDPQFNAERCRAFLESVGGKQVEVVRGA